MSTRNNIPRISSIFIVTVQKFYSLTVTRPRIKIKVVVPVIKKRREKTT